MVSLNHYLADVYQSTSLASAFERRSALVQEMQKLENQTIHCFTCPGTCCTQVANSMLITPVEALEILHSLGVENFDPEKMQKFKERMSDTIKSFRLNVEIYTGKKNSTGFRKTYTCPFFNHEALGCGLSRASKPYGCLGFNPKTSDDNGKSCSSNIELLTERDNTFIQSEDQANLKIRNDLKLSWSKQNIPQALLDILERLSL